MNHLFIFGAKYLWLAAPIIVALYFLRQDRSKWRDMIIYGALTAIIALILALIASRLYSDPRPFVVGGFQPLIPHGADNGFPSDHALIVSALAAFMFAYSRKASAWLWAIAVAVGASRVYVGVHHPIDILGSMLICIVAAALARQIKDPRPRRGSHS